MPLQIQLISVPSCLTVYLYVCLTVLPPVCLSVCIPLSFSSCLSVPSCLSFRSFCLLSISPCLSIHSCLTVCLFSVPSSLYGCLSAQSQPVPYRGSPIFSIQVNRKCAESLHSQSDASVSASPCSTTLGIVEVIGYRMRRCYRQNGSL